MSGKKRGPAPSITIEMVQEKLDEHNITALDLEGEYKNSTTQFSVRYPIDVDPEQKIRTLTWMRLRKGVFYKGKITKYTIGDVRKVGEKFQLTLLDDKYENDTKAYRFECDICHKEKKIIFKNLLRKERVVGCEDCGRKTPWDEIKKVFLEADCKLLSKRMEYKNDRETKLEFICSCGKRGKRSLKQFNKAPHCQACTMEQREETNLEVYGHKNVLASEYGKQKTREFYQKNYGPDIIHNMQVPEIHQKSKDTCMQLYGCEYGFTQPWVYDKIRERNIEKYGVPFTFQNPQELQKARDVLFERYGECFMFKLQWVKEKKKQTNVEKYGNEVFLASEDGKAMMVEKYGNAMFLHSEIGKRLMVEKYGAPYAMQSRELFEKAMKNTFAYKKYTLPSGQEILVQGYEPFALDDLLNEHGYEEEQIIASTGKSMPIIDYFFNKKKRKYYPDIFIPSENRIIEVKSDWTMDRDYQKNIAKYLAVIAQGYEMEYWVFDKHKECTVTTFD